MNEQKIRHYDLDWLRVIAIIILLLFHTGMFFNVWGWHVKNEEQSKLMSDIMVWFHHWRMPLLLFISGAGTFFALGFRSSKQFIRERAKRLMIPLIFGIFVVVPPQIYFEFINNFNSYIDFYPTVFEFVPYPLGGSFSWHHLWFILYLFIYSALCLPLFLYLRGNRSEKFKTKLLTLTSKPWGFAYFLFPMIISQFILRPFFPEQSHDLRDLGYFVHYLLYFISGYIIYSDKNIWVQLKLKRKFHLKISIIAIIIFYIAWFIPYETTFFSYDFLFHIPATIMSWFTILTIIGYGQTYLNKKSEVLTNMNTAIYPFYILHQSVMIIFGYYIIKWNLGIFEKFVIINLLTAIVCVGTYQVIIKPFNIMRILFGMRSKPKKNVKSETVNLAYQKAK